MSPLAIYLIVVCGILLIGFLLMWASAAYNKSTADYNMDGWKRAAFFHKEEEEKRIHAEKQWRDMMAIANKNADEAERLEKRLRKFGLYEE